MRYEVTIAERIYYTITVEANSEAEAREMALVEHEEGLSSQSDGGAGEVEDVRELAYS
jgi:hypothetical protein